MNIGSETKRANLRMTVIRGGVGQRPNRISETHPVKTGEGIDPILSGMVMTLENDGGTLKWVRGNGGNVAGQFFFAVDDSTQGDVAAAGTLQGYSVLEAYTLRIAQFAADDYVAGDKLTPDGTTGKVKKAEAGDVVIAVVALDYAQPINLGHTYTPVDGDANVSDGVKGGTYVVGRATNAESLEALHITTVQPYTIPEASA
jgi:hypothetical protein